MLRAAVIYRQKYLYMQLYLAAAWLNKHCSIPAINTIFTVQSQMSVWSSLLKAWHKAPFRAKSTALTGDVHCFHGCSENIYYVKMPLEKWLSRLWFQMSLKVGSYGGVWTLMSQEVQLLVSIKCGQKWEQYKIKVLHKCCSQGRDCAYSSKHSCCFKNGIKLWTLGDRWFPNCCWYEWDLST